MTETASQLEIYRAKTIGTNVNSITLLATDYLNHFNEALMLAELAPDMPEMLDDFLAWAPKHYRDHFRESGIADKELAIDAFDISPPEYRDPFENLIKMLNKQLTLMQKILDRDRDTLGAPENKDFVSAKCTLIRGLIDRVGGIINGHLSANSSTSNGKALSEPAGSEKSSNIIEASEGETLDQAVIDALFD